MRVNKPKTYREATWISVSISVGTGRYTQLVSAYLKTANVQVEIYNF